MDDRGRSAWLLVVVTVLAASSGVTSANAGSPHERQVRRAIDLGVDQQRSTASTPRSAPRTARMRLRGGKVITVWRICVMRKDIAGKNRAVEAEADRLDPLEAVVNARKSALQSFLRAHPEKALPPATYQVYRTLRDSYSVALSRFNAQVARYNAAARRHNDVLHACEV
jgi:hypothetical protein